MPDMLRPYRVTTTQGTHTLMARTPAGREQNRQRMARRRRPAHHTTASTP